MDAQPGESALLIGALARARRRRLALTLQEVSDAAGISTGYLSLIERDKATPTMTTLARIARALHVGIDYFVARPLPTDCVSRAAERGTFVLGAAQIHYERLGAVFPGATLNSFLMSIAPDYRSEVVTHAGEETIFVVSGTLVLMLDGEELTLETGDSAHYDASRPHGWANETGAVARVLWTGTLDLFAESTETMEG
ncbi:helix-turn-helix domain-containing protein [Cognatishimia sp. F0-27]|uniref:helix-turn-helix domain-containing protein n=1 Tax=Cognatishimia sp. F0-27 TaxID=2816855 RepID=UPI001D0CB848|nr:XRE family transcriptional regulator [Cognatishimia sp. F0-27]MCC1493140.1 cupin domain-containing protein [Cognatishimia sp. F0-27]